MTRTELITELKKMQKLSTDDAEMAHSAADEYLLEYINDKLIKESFLKITRWYA